MSRFGYEDKLEPLGVLTGALIVIVGLGALVGTPWTTNPNTLAAAIQAIGIVVAIAVGVVLAVLSYSGDLSDLRPGKNE